MSPRRAGADLQIILLGDSATGKSKLVERYLVDNYAQHQLSTYALTLFRKDIVVDGQSSAPPPRRAARAREAARPHASPPGAAAASRPARARYHIDFWDTAGQERFQSLHASYYHRAHACILCFDVTRKVTYKNLVTWYKELRENRKHIPCICVANKVDVDAAVTNKAFGFPEKHRMPLFMCSAADGTNVVQARARARPRRAGASRARSGARAQACATRARHAVRPMRRPSKPPWPRRSRAPNGRRTTFTRT